ncbi:MAG: response regulator [Alphaproteobacteria bacterium]|nr:response regulator [Alphaproteobacteria bacterium]
MAVSSHRILFVEDDKPVRDLVEEVLLDEGFAVDAVATIGAALALLAANNYDLVLTDGRLPDGTGYSVAHAASAKDIKVLVYTAYGLEFSNNERASYPVLAKPVRISELLLVIRHFLGTNLVPAKKPMSPSVGGAVIFDA